MGELDTNRCVTCTNLYHAAERDGHVLQGFKVKQPLDSSNAFLKLFYSVGLQKAEISHEPTTVGITVKCMCFLTILVVLMDIYAERKAPHRRKAVISVFTSLDKQ